MDAPEMNGEGECALDYATVQLLLNGIHGHEAEEKGLLDWR